ncbi:8-oxo-dGTP pyrophosphatase MutT (NUDIX family) [Christiangramia gaetbulicola]|uniref:8-oxo-dGTP pyrophosphatase MutT (NUDIX family) n=1 Tax=Christiangramia gaetbulicola TaxID=703340 RepID=A0A2T6AHU9_9FLAO|nr:CoA pyrophosphatase [Christiangramia gaetbulicola]PTX43371.1 8-oxo-dGTP pyrophosphatase MutT (NUDIX family) [Christiangramia gaetbulicola]
MEFEIFKNRISKLKKLQLPGESAHRKLAPLIRINELEEIDMSKRNPQEAGVMAVFYPDMDMETRLVLILRKTYNGVHSNQVGFPGGRVEESDKNLEDTALRETEEEVGIPQNEIEVVRKLTRLYIPPSNFWVQPYLGLMQKTPNMIPQESEVEEILEVKLSDFLNDENVITENLSTSYAKEIEVPAYSLNGHVVWGATGMMLSEIRELLLKI